MVILKPGVNDTGTVEYYFVGLEKYEDIEVVLDQLIHMHARILETLDGIYSRVATLDMEGANFKVIYHEDVGVYSYIINQSSPEANDWLKRVLEQAVNNINAGWNSPSQ
jgi:hypothetical protein